MRGWALFCSFVLLPAVVLGCFEIRFWQDTEGLRYNVPPWMTIQLLLQRIGL